MEGEESWVRWATGQFNRHALRNEWKEAGDHYRQMEQFKLAARDILIAEKQGARTVR